MKQTVMILLILCSIMVRANEPENLANSRLIRVSAHCVGEDNPDLYFEHVDCTKRAVGKLAKKVCLSHHRILNVKPRVSIGCSPRGSLYICQGHATAVCGMPERSIALTKAR